MPAKDIEERVRKLAEKNPEKGEEQFALNQVQNEVYGINSELANNLEQERNSSALLQKNNEALAQAAEIGVSGGGGLNPSTQEILKKYGYQGRPEIKMNRPTGNPPTQGRPVIINNNYNTTNNVVAGGDDQGNSNKFKAWLSNVFTRQKNDFEIQQKEYRKREWSLSRSANKMMRKMERISKSFSEQMNPQNMGKTVGSQLKVILLAIIGTLLVKYWRPVMDAVVNIESAVKSAFGIPLNAKAKGTKGVAIVDSIREFLGVDPKGSGKDKSLISSLGSLITSGINTLIEKFKDWMGDRGEAVRNVSSPNFKEMFSGFGGRGTDSTSRILRSIGGSIGAMAAGVSQYLRDILSAMVTGKSVNREVSKLYTADLDRDNYWARNDAQLKELDSKRPIGGKDQNYFRSSDLRHDKTPDITPQANIASSNILTDALKDKSLNNLHIGSLITLLNNLTETADKNGEVPVTDELISVLNKAGVSEELLNRLRKSGKLTKKTYKTIRVPKTDEDFNDLLGPDSTIDEAFSGSTIFMGGPIKGAKVWNEARKRTNQEEDVPGYKFVVVPGDDPRTGITSFDLNTFDSEGIREILKTIGLDELDQYSPQSYTKAKQFMIDWKTKVHGVNPDDIPTEATNLDRDIKKYFTEERKKKEKDRRREEKYRTDPKTAQWYRFLDNSSELYDKASGKLEEWFYDGREKAMEYIPQNVSDKEIKESGLKLMNALIQAGLSPVQAAGLVGNFYAESGNLRHNVPNREGSGAYGLAQWLGQRREDFKKKFGHDLNQSTFEEQVEYIIHELTNTDYKKYLDKTNEYGSRLTPTLAADLGLGYYEFLKGPEDAIQRMMNNGKYSMSQTQIEDTLNKRRNFAEDIYHTWTKIAEINKESDSWTPDDIRKGFGEDIFSEIKEKQLAEFKRNSSSQRMFSTALEKYNLDPTKGYKLSDDENELTYLDGVPVLNFKGEPLTDEEKINYILSSFSKEEKIELYKKWFPGFSPSGEGMSHLFVEPLWKGDQKDIRYLTLDLNKPVSKDIRKLLKEDLSKNLGAIMPLTTADRSRSVGEYSPTDKTYKDLLEIYYRKKKNREIYSARLKNPESFRPKSSSFEFGSPFSLSSVEYTPKRKIDEGTPADLSNEIAGSLQNIEGLLALQIQSQDQISSNIAKLVVKPYPPSQYTVVQGSKTPETSNTNGE